MFPLKQIRYPISRFHDTLCSTRFRFFFLLVLIFLLTSFRIVFEVYEKATLFLASIRLEDAYIALCPDIHVLQRAFSFEAKIDDDNGTLLAITLPFSKEEHFNCFAYLSLFIYINFFSYYNDLLT